MGGTLEAKYREQFSILFRALLEKEFPIALMNELQLQEPVPPPLKPYIFVMPRDHLVFDYRFIKEVRKYKEELKSDFIHLNFLHYRLFFYTKCIYYYAMNFIIMLNLYYFSIRVKENGNYGLMN